MRLSLVSKISLSWRRKEVCKLLLCFAQSSYYFCIGFVSGGMKGFVFLGCTWICV